MSAGKTIGTIIGAAITLKATDKYILEPLKKEKKKKKKW